MEHKKDLKADPILNQSSGGQSQNPGGREEKKLQARFTPTLTPQYLPAVAATFMFNIHHVIIFPWTVRSGASAF